MIETFLLRYAVAAADTGSFSQAADQFGIKQSTLSKSIHYLKDILGLALFTRSTRGVAPTDPGRSFLERARRILDDVDGLLSDARALARGDAGVLRIGLHASLAEGNLAATLRAFRDRYRDVEIEAREQNRSALFDAVERGGIDLAVTAGRSSTLALRSAALWSDPLTIALPAAHPLATLDNVYWTDLRGARFVVTADDPGPDISAMITARLAGPGHLPTITAQHVSRHNLLSFVTADRVAVSTGLTAHTDPEPIVIRRIHDAFGASAIEQRLHWRRDNPSAPLARFPRSSANGKAAP